MAEEKPRTAKAEGVEKKETKASERKPVKVAAVVIYRDSQSEWRWRALSSNGRTIADSSEGYRNRPWARKMALDLYPDAKVVWGAR